MFSRSIVNLYTTWRWLAVSIVVLLVVVACGDDAATTTTTAATTTTTAATMTVTAITPAATTTTTAATDPLADLVAAAQAEGSVVFYSSVAPAVLPLIADAFEAKYGIPVEFLRLSSSDLIPRFSSEADSGVFAPDVMSLGAADAYEVAQAWAEQGWLTPLADVDLPVLSEFPAEFATDLSAIVNIAPFFITYNTDLLEASEAPQSWEDLIDPRFEGEIIIAAPGGSTKAFFTFLHDRYGAEWFQQLCDLNPRVAGGVVPAFNSLVGRRRDAPVPQCDQCAFTCGRRRCTGGRCST